MTPEKIIIGIVLTGLGLLFFFNNQSIAKGAYKFYQKLYTEKNLIVMFKVFGTFLMVIGIILIFAK